VQSSGPSLIDSHEAAKGGFGQQSGVTIMAQIGTFTRDESGAFAGNIRTLTLNVKATIRSSPRENDKAPDYRVYAPAGVEIGAGWSPSRFSQRHDHRPAIHLATPRACSDQPSHLCWSQLARITLIVFSLSGR
jgi:uncharacterized protein (DUF736 family)